MKSRTHRWPLLGAILCLPHASEATLKHHYTFDEKTGTVAADSAGTSHGTIGANVTLGAIGRLGSAFAFPALANSPASRVTLPNTVVPGTEFTMAAFVKLAAPLANGGQMHVISGNNGATGRWNFGINDNDATAGVDARLFWFHNGGVGAVSYSGFDFNQHVGQWVHIGITRAANGSTTLYVNGAPQGIGSSSAALVSTPVGIGLRPNAAQFQFHGSIDELRFYSTALSAVEMADLSQQTGDTDEDGLPDDWEILHFENLLQGPDDDPDNDGFSNRIEFLAGTNPADSNSFPAGDSDGDGMDDGWEWRFFGSLTRDGLGDFDNDGALDLEEYEAAQGLKIERDPSGAITGVVPFSGSSNPADPDSQPDSDEDGLPDGWEYRSFNDLLEGRDDDTDGDTFTNWQEFLAGSNPDNEFSIPGDVDGDGLLDAWEIQYFGSLSQGPAGDFDNDGSSNLAEFEAGSDPADPASQPDIDNDGLPDGWETIYFGGLDEGADDDFDGDGFTNLQEWAAGSNPKRIRNTPANVNDTVLVAVATSAGVDEYSVQRDVWTFVRRLYEGETTAVTFHDGFLYAASPDAIRRIDPEGGPAVLLTARNQGDALAAGWTTATARGIEFGPDGRLYFATAFGTAQGQGVFRMNPDGSGFDTFIARNGTGYELNNAIDVAWKDANTLFVTSRGGFDATNRFIYQFDATGAYTATVADSLQGPQGLLIDGETLWVSGTNSARALLSLNLTDPFPLAPQVVRTAGPTNPEVIEILGELHVVAFAGNILKDVSRPALKTVLSGMGTGVNANDMVVFTRSAASPYDAWAQGFGIDPSAPGGAPGDDFDGDGSTNGIEFALGLDPTDGTSRFALTTSGSAAAGLELRWPSAEGVTFEIRSSTDLSDWSTLEATVQGQPGQSQATWTAPAAQDSERRFYRVQFNP